MRSRIAPFGFGAGLAAHRLRHDRIEGRIQQTLHQNVGGVVGPGRLAGVAGEFGEGEVRTIAAHPRGEREQALVDAAQLLGAEVSVIHRAQDPVLAGEGKMAQRFEEVVVGQLRIVQIGRGVPAPEEAAEGGKCEAPARDLEVGLARKSAGEEPELPPEVAVTGALDPAREVTQSRSAVVRGVRLARGPSNGGIVMRMEQRLPVEGAVLGDEEKNQPVHHAQDLAMETVRWERPGPQRLAEYRIAGMAREAPAENPQCSLHAPAQLAERASALPFGFAGPLFQPAGLGPVTLARCET